MDSDLQRLKTCLLNISPISDATMNEMLAEFSELLLDENQCLISIGEPAKHVGFVVSGLIREYFLTDKGKEFNKAFILPDMFTGSLFDLLSGQPSTATVQALTASRLLIAPYQRCLDLFARDITMERLARKFAEQLFVQKARREYELICLDATQRYLALLKSHPGIETRISQYHIASYLGITPVSLSRIRRQIASQ